VRLGQRKEQHVQMLHTQYTFGMGLLSYRCEGAIKHRQCAAINQCYSALMFTTPIAKTICSMNKKQFEFADIFGFTPHFLLSK
jgi:hypothetical protein